MGRIRLTDQALVAVAVARSGAGERGATVGDLLAGLAVEPEGRAGRHLRTSGQVLELVQRAPVVPTPLLEIAVADAAAASAPRPAATDDLLAAAVRVGGEDVADLLAVAGYDVARLALVDPFAHREVAETFGLAPGAVSELSPVAGRVVAQVRAVAGGAVELLLAIAAAPDADGAALLPDADALRAAAAVVDVPDDHGLEAVLAAARRVFSGSRVTTADLVRAAVTAGGQGPLALVEEAERAG